MHNWFIFVFIFNLNNLPMKKTFAFSLTLFCFTISYSQVGIETAYPKGAFHVDGNKDNPKDATTTVTNTQQANDFPTFQINQNNNTIIPVVHFDY